MCPEVLIDAWLLAVQVAGERKARNQKHEHITKIAEGLRAMIDSWPPAPDTRAHAHKGLLDFTARR